MIIEFQILLVFVCFCMSLYPFIRTTHDAKRTPPPPLTTISLVCCDPTPHLSRLAYVDPLAF